MLITKEQQATWVSNYVKQRHTSDECIGFIDGIEHAINVISKGCIDKQVAIRFAQSLTNHEVTEQDLTEFLNNK
jgi:hypothetical protein